VEGEEEKEKELTGAGTLALPVNTCISSALVPGKNWLPVFPWHRLSFDWCLLV
jgi:hypothetical protein